MAFQSTFQAADRAAWRAWLSSNGTTCKEVWLVYTKKHTGRPCISYEDSVEEALCFGWIDSIIKRIDDATYARKFTPRSDSENWSDLNKKRVAKCIREGRMTEAGMAKIRYSNADQPPRPAAAKAIEVPEFMTKAMKENPTAWKNFNALPPSHRRNYTLWISSAKREETREKRLKEAIAMLEQNERLGLK